MKKIIDLFKVMPVDCVDYYSYLRDESRKGLRVWITFDPDKLKEFDDALDKKQGGDSILAPVKSRIKTTFPECEDLIYCAIYGASDAWQYFFLPAGSYEISVNDVLHKLLWLLEQFHGDSFGQFTNRIRKMGYDLNSYDMELLEEIHDKLQEQGDLLCMTLRNGHATHGLYSSERRTLSIKYIESQFE